MVRSLFYVLILLLLYFIIQFIFFPNPPKLLAKIPPVIQSKLKPKPLVSNGLIVSLFSFIYGIMRNMRKMEAVRRLLGHKSISATSSYLGVEDSDATALAKSINI